MKTLCLLAVTCSVLLSTQVWAASPEKISCSTIGENTQCIYKVYGEDSSHPASASKLYLNTNMPYALCASSKCIIDKDNPKMAQCPCLAFGVNKDKKAWQQASVGPLPFESAKPSTTNGKMAHLTSTYSSAGLTNSSNKTSISCVSSSPAAWANCYGAKCSISKDGKTAMCQCPIVKSITFVSVGPSNQSECKLKNGQVWSAATTRQDDNNNFIMKIFYEKNHKND